MDFLKMNKPAFGKRGFWLIALILTGCASPSFSSGSLSQASSPSSGVSSHQDSSSSSEGSSSAKDSSSEGSSASSESSTNSPSSSSSNPASSSASSTVSSASEGSGYQKLSGNGLSDTFNFSALQKSQDRNALPSSGAHSLLVLPIEFSDYPFAEQTLTDLGVAFNGQSKADTGYWESVSSFFKKSSYGALSLSYTLADKYVTNQTAKAFYDAYPNDPSSASCAIGRSALEAYKARTGDAAASFDSDQDGFLDSLILIYSCPDNERAPISSFDTDGLFWAYCDWDDANRAHASLASPIMDGYFWASYDFLYANATSPCVDPHVFIHETGHLMGLPDYYDYNAVSNPTTGKRCHPSPLGGVAMMDSNITDEDAYTKFVLGWLHPYFVTGDCTITLHASADVPEAILLPSASWNGGAFDEYLLLELYAPRSLNELDSTTKYRDKTLGYSESGIRLLHADSRLADLTDGAYFLNPSAPFTSRHYFGLPASNTPSRRKNPASAYNLVTLVQATGVNTLKYGQGQGANSNLFHAGESFAMKNYSAFFENGTLFDNGEAPTFSFHVDALSAGEATLTFTHA
jgi:M6 family metalloprotease-like protein